MQVTKWILSKLKEPFGIGNAVCLWRTEVGGMLFISSLLCLLNFESYKYRLVKIF